ncbi:hypothetical protein [uncultured Winogradskyella sp.]|uniref:hypothetical protein n=1 Tax=uncultured Winogradskyella sp. TaxID=395353 RepID=UPI00262F37C0|nr:hypothetical protein [uncultured Winogradskyella sp.]
MNIKNFGNILTFGIGILIFSFSVFLTIKIAQNTSGNLTLAIISLIIFYWLSYLFIATSLIRMEYRKSEKGINIKINNEDKQLVIKNTGNGKSEVINNDNVKSIELYYSWNTNPFSSDLGYSKIMLNNDSKIFITQDKISQAEIKSLFRKKVKKEKSQFMNKLK